MEAISRFAGLLGILSGALLTLSEFTGSADALLWLRSSLQHITTHPALFRALDILIYISALGGIAVLIGGILLYYEFRLTGKLFIILGAGIGFLAFFYSLAQAWIAGQDMIEFIKGYASTLQGMGILLAIAAYSLG
ncbi:MAG: hypothetical protein J7K08_00675 [Thermoplasmata archaeon]|nr:hypothetical protein [Thermoplasmata archaeon]RLF73617.1 MAG: hypothetical protein DRN55_02945 [Thermoplasmata archaeon]RLF76392.1 MAG: hypothetical protein DRN42_01125 [Thermoplasmata archaeon]HDD60793.1 hypothetical protein [Euryarchaeota archaeon]